MGWDAGRVRWVRTVAVVLISIASLLVVASGLLLGALIRHDLSPRWWALDTTMFVAMLVFASFGGWLFGASKFQRWR